MTRTTYARLIVEVNKFLCLRASERVLWKLPVGFGMINAFSSVQRQFLKFIGFRKVLCGYETAS